MRSTVLSRRPARALRAGVVGLLALGLTAACGGGDDAPAASPSASPSSEAAAAAPAPPPPDTWPLDGLPVAAGKSSSLDHPVVVLKMDNTSSSAPQVGLGRADMVVEELVEGGLTRLAAFFYSRIPTEAGPVRSMRASDIGIVTPVEASVVTSGAASITIARIQKAGIEYFNEGAKGFYRESSRYAPYNLFTNLRETTTLTKAAPARPADYLPWGDGAGLPTGKPVSGLVARFGSGHSTEWAAQGERWVNENSYAAEGDRFQPRNVLVLRVKVGDAGYLDPAGYPVPETRLTGGGPAELFRDGQRYKLRWSKESPRSPLQLTSKAQPVTVPAGKTWIELVPIDGGEVTVTP